MTRSLQRQLEQEVDVKKNFGFDPKDLNPNEMLKQREDNTFSPPHEEEDEHEGQNESEAEEDDIEKTDESKPAA